MEVSDKLIEAIKQFEGFRSQSYRCPAGVLTIGYGHTKGVKLGMRITEREAEVLLREDLKEFERYVENLHVVKSQGQFDALVDFCFNLGIKALEGSTLLKLIKQHADEVRIRYQFMRWIYSGKKILPGLVKRREWEADRFFNKS